MRPFALLVSLVLVVSLALPVTSCRSKQDSTSPATAEGLVKMVLTEDATVMNICNALQLDPDAPERPPLSDAAVAELELEVQADFAVVLRALEVAEGLQRDQQLSCEPARLARVYLADAKYPVQASEADRAGAEACLGGLRHAAELTVLLDDAVRAAPSAAGEAAGIDPKAVVAALEQSAPAVVSAWAEGCAGDAACVPKKVLAYAGAEGELVTPEVARRLRAGARLVEGLGLHELDLQALREDPGRLLRHVDFSFVVLVKMIEFGELSQQTIEDVTGSFGWVGGIVGTLLQAVAAEIVAAVNERMFGLLEKQRLVNRASVARRACGLWQNGDARSVVATRMLKRTILRLSAAKVRDDSAADVCRRSSADRRRCEKLARRLGGTLEETRRRPELIALTPEEAEAVVQQAAAGAVSAPGDAARPGPSLQVQSELLLAAAEACHQNGRTDPACIGDLSSLGLFLLDPEAEAGDGAGAPEPAARFGALVSTLSTMHSSLVGLEKKLGEVSEKLDDLHVDVDALDRRLAAIEDHRDVDQRQTQARLHELGRGVQVLILREAKSKCAVEIERVWKNRYRYLRARVEPASLAALGLTASPESEVPTAKEMAALEGLCKGSREGAFVGAKGDRFDASQSVKAFCEAGMPFELGTLRTSSLFASGRAELDPQLGTPAADDVRRAIEAVAAIAGSAATLDVSIIGHTDQVPLVKLVDGKKVGNTWLSTERAKAFQRALQAKPLPAGVTLHATGRGPAELAVDCGEGSEQNRNDPCHAQNRRVTVSIATTAFTVNYAECMQ